MENPIALFFSVQNAKQLFGYIQKSLQERYHVLLDDTYMEQMIDVMKLVIKPLPKKIPAIKDDKKLLEFVKGLNKQTLREAIPLFAEIAKGKSPTPVIGQKDPILPPPPPIKDTIGSVPVPEQSTPLKHKDIDKVYEHLQRERQASTSLPIDKPNFEDPEVEYEDDVNDLYENAEQAREYEDIIPQPEPDQELPFTPQEGFNIRNEPLKYMKKGPPPSPSRNNNEQDAASTPYNPDAFFGDIPPRGSERGGNAPQQIDKNFTDVNFALKSGQLLTFDDIAPQPAQMRVLIPKTSRNTIHDSQTIPHVFVVNSCDRNPTVYPNASDYRIQLREPYLDVVSVELASATVPLSTFVVNENNNVIVFEEVAGTELTAIIPIGNYPDVSALAMAVAVSMTAKSAIDGNTVTYTSSVNMLTNQITLTSDGAGGSIFNLLFAGAPLLEGGGTPEYRREKPQYRENSIGPVLGYDAANYMDGVLSYQAPFVPNLNGEPNVYVHIEELEHLESNNAEIHNAFAEIPLSPSGTESGYARYAPTSAAQRFVKYFSPPKGKLANLTISLRNVNGQLINFNGLNHTFVIEIITRDKTQGPYDEVVHNKQP